MSDRRIVIIGADGQLGTDLMLSFRSRDPVGLTHRDIEICDPAGTRQTLQSIHPDVVVNTAAFVRVDACEDQVEHAFAVNAFGARTLATICADLGAALVQISTDYVFDGETSRPYVESDTPRPINVYGNSKLAGEHFVRSICPRHLVIRSSGLYGKAGSRGKGGNFVETMARLAEERSPIRVVDDQVLSPTCTLDLAEAIAALVERGEIGLFHVTNGGQCSWYEFARAIFAALGLRADLAPTTSAARATRARRPRFSVLDNARWRALALPSLLPWQEALERFLRHR